MNMDIKTVQPAEAKFDDDAGTVTAVFAKMNVVDLDGDVTLPGFFGTQDVAIADAHDRAKLVGRGTIREDGDTAVFDGKFFLETIKGREAYLTTKAMGDLQEWSYGFYIKNGGARLGTLDGRDVRFLQPLENGDAGVKVAEVSPVLVGAGIGTHTVSMKAEGLRFVEQAEQVAQAAEMLFTRATEIHDMRAEKGKQLGDDAVARLLNVKTRLEAVATMMSDLTSPPDPVDTSTLGFGSAIDTLHESQQLLGGR